MLWKWEEGDARLGLSPVNVKAHLLIDCCITGILTPAAGRATHQLPGPRVVDGVLPAGRVLLVGRFILGARHGDIFFFFWVAVGPNMCGFFSLKKRQKRAAGDVVRRRSRRGGGEWSGRCRERESRRREMLCWNKKTRRGRWGRERGGGISDVHTSPVVEADAVRPDGCTLANDGETHGDAPLRAQIINRAHTIFLIIDYIIKATCDWEQAGVSILCGVSAGCGNLPQTRGKRKKCAVFSVKPNDFRTHWICYKVFFVFCGLTVTSHIILVYSVFTTAPLRTRRARGVTKPVTNPTGQSVFRRQWMLLISLYRKHFFSAHTHTHTHTHTIPLSDS